MRPFRVFPILLLLMTGFISGSASVYAQGEEFSNESFDDSFDGESDRALQMKEILSRVMQAHGQFGNGDGLSDSLDGDNVQGLEALSGGIDFNEMSNMDEGLSGGADLDLEDKPALKELGETILRDHRDLLFQAMQEILSGSKSFEGLSHMLENQDLEDSEVGSSINLGEE